MRAPHPGRRWSGSFFLWHLLLLMGACASKRPLCPTIVMNGDKIEFSDSEIKLLCGDPKIEAWDNIPLPQVELQLKHFLLERGYGAPRISTVRGDNGTAKVQVFVGNRALLKKLEIQGWPAASGGGQLHDPFPESRYIGRTLNPKLLDELETQALFQLRSGGYGCAKVTSEANAIDGRVTLKIDTGDPQSFGSIERLAAAGFDPALLSGWEAFETGESYDVRLLTLSERRIREQASVQDVAYVPVCDTAAKAGERTLRITQQAFVGAPRLLSLGAGFDTEQYFKFRARMNAVRLNAAGARVAAVAQASLKKQTFDSTLEWPTRDPLDRQNALLNAVLQRENEDQYDTVSLTGRLGWRWRFEQLRSTSQLQLAQLLERVWVRRGVGPSKARVLGIEAGYGISSHLFEYYATDPQAGYRANLLLQGTSSELGSSFTALRVLAKIEAATILWESARVSAILAGRAGFNGMMTPPDKRGLVPPDRKFYLGGSQDLRGFGRKELPRNSPDGAFTVLYAGMELRLTRVLPVEPFVFGDMGSVALGEEGEKFPLYVSPGLGIRYASPIGTVRATAAYGFAARPEATDAGRAHPQYFLSLGEEF